MGTVTMSTATRWRIVTVGAVVALMTVAATTASAGGWHHGPVRRGPTQLGVVASGDDPIPHARVTMMEAGRRPGAARFLGTTRADSDGRFALHYRRPRHDAVLYLVADGGPGSRRGPVRLATVLGGSDIPDRVTINERTTVAAAFAMAQFIEGSRIGGNTPGMPNSAATYRNLVNLADGAVGQVLASSPNGEETSTLRTFNSLANMLSACVRDVGDCGDLFRQATPADAPRPRNTLDAAVNIAHYPGHDVADLLEIAHRQPTYQPALPPGAAGDPAEPNYINSYALALRFTGAGPDGPVMDGPGNIAFDSHGNAWVNNNYAYEEDQFRVTCGSTALLKLSPDGSTAPGAPFGGDDATQDGVGAGGLYGAGFGIAVDTKDEVWVTNFGFQGQKLIDASPKPDCENIAADLAVSVSHFDNDGIALSPDGDPSADLAGGYLVGSGPLGELGQPQGVKSDRRGNVWVTGCIDGKVALFPRGDPDRARIATISDAPNVDDFDKAFDVAIDHRGHAWVTGNETSNVVEVNRRLEVLTNLTDGFDKPMGIAVDSAGNLWVADAGIPNPPCPPALSDDPSGEIGGDGVENVRAAVSLIDRSGRRPVVEKFGKVGPEGAVRDGLRWPWGIAVDGNDNVWVANFAGKRVMQLCGAARATCPDGRTTGDPVSPDSGYYHNGLERVTAVEIDPSGNVWMTNNWKIDGFTHPENPGGHQVVVYVGLAAPVRTPLLGPPRQP